MDGQIDSQVGPQRRIAPWVPALILLVIVFIAIVVVELLAHSSINRTVMHVPTGGQFTAPNAGVVKAPAPQLQQDQDANQPQYRASQRKT